MAVSSILEAWAYIMIIVVCFTILLTLIVCLIFFLFIKKRNLNNLQHQTMVKNFQNNLQAACTCLKHEKMLNNNTTTTTTTSMSSNLAQTESTKLNGASNAKCTFCCDINTKTNSSSNNPIKTNANNCNNNNKMSKSQSNSNSAKNNNNLNNYNLIYQKKLSDFLPQGVVVASNCSQSSAFGNNTTNNKSATTETPTTMLQTNSLVNYLFDKLKLFTSLKTATEPDLLGSGSSIADELSQDRRESSKSDSLVCGGVRQMEIKEILPPSTRLIKSGCIRQSTTQQAQVKRSTYVRNSSLPTASCHGVVTFKTTTSSASTMDTNKKKKKGLDSDDNDDEENYDSFNEDGFSSTDENPLSYAKRKFSNGSSTTAVTNTSSFTESRKKVKINVVMLVYLD